MTNGFLLSYRDLTDYENCTTLVEAIHVDDFTLINNCYPMECPLCNAQHVGYYKLKPEFVKKMQSKHGEYSVIAETYLCEIIGLNMGMEII